MSLAGGTGAQKPVTDEVAGLTTGLKAEVEAKTGTTYTTFTPVNFASQVVAGTNYFVSVDVGEGNFVHVRIYKPLPHTGAPASVHSVATGKAAADAVAYF